MRCNPKKAETFEQTLKSLQEKYSRRGTQTEYGLNSRSQRQRANCFIISKKNYKKETISVESQTQLKFQEYACNECVYLASCVDELNWHLEKEHDQDDKDDPDEPSGHFTCYICRTKN